MKEELGRIAGNVVHGGVEKLKAEKDKLLSKPIVSESIEKIKTEGDRLLSSQIVTEGIEKIKSESARLKEEAINLMDEYEKKKAWSGYDSIPTGKAGENIVPGCLVLEGGAFRGCYTSGVLDVLMENGINIQTTVGTSAGALNGYNYVAGEIGRSAKINLGYRHDSRYIGPVSAAKSRGVIGFNFILDEIEDELPFDRERFESPDRRLVVTVTDCETGEVHYMEKGVCGDFVKAVQASASMPFVSEPVEVEGMNCLDGGCAVKIPYKWAMEQGFEKILVIRTRPAGFRREEEGKRFRELSALVYKKYPQLAELLCTQGAKYNEACDELEKLSAEGKLLMISPSGSIAISQLESDTEKLGALYLLGRCDAMLMLPKIKAFFGIED